MQKNSYTAPGEGGWTCVCQKMLRAFPGLIARQMLAMRRMERKLIKKNRDSEVPPLRGVDQAQSDLH